jgi:hypothetical protein
METVDLSGDTRDDEQPLASDATLSYASNEIALTGCENTGCKRSWCCPGGEDLAVPVTEILSSDASG